MKKIYIENKRGVKMELSNGELMVMEELWKGECLDEKGEIQRIYGKCSIWNNTKTIYSYEQVFKTNYDRIRRNTVKDK